MQQDKLHNSSAFSSMAEHISPDTLPWCCVPAFTQETTHMSAAIVASPSAALLISTTLRIVFLNGTNVASDMLTHLIHLCLIEMQYLPNTQLRKVMSQNSTYSRIATIIPSCQSTPTPTRQHRYSTFYYLKNCQNNLDAITLGLLNVHAQIRCICYPGTFCLPVLATWCQSCLNHCP